MTQSKIKATVGRIRVYDGTKYRVNEVSTSYGIDEIIRALQHQGEDIPDVVKFNADVDLTTGQLTRVRASWEVVVGVLADQKERLHGDSREAEHS